MADGHDDTTSQWAYMYPMRQTGRSQPSSATLTGSTMGDYSNIHQGDQNMNIEQFHHVTNNYACPLPHMESRPTSCPHQGRPRTPCWTVPFGRNKDFVGRESILNQLVSMISPTADKEDCQRTVITGLGGVGKTQIALEAAFRVRARCPDCHVFWVPAINTTTFVNAYHEIGRELNIQIDEDDKDDETDIKLLVKAALSQSSDHWLLIIDNADDATLFGETSEVTSLRGYLPFNLKGSILFTTRNAEVSQKLDIRIDNIIHLMGMSQSEAANMLQKGLALHQMSDAQSLESLLEFLANLPLAIKQASAYMIKTGIAISQYLEYCRSSDEALNRMLSKNFDDRTRYETTQNPIATTWMISFEAISRDNPLAASYLRFMSFLAEKDIPKDLHPPASDESNAFEAIGALKAYGFISERECGDAYDMHRLVRLVMQNWMRENKGELQTHITTVMQCFDEVVPLPFFWNKDKWARCLPHMTMALKFRNHVVDKVLLSSILKKAANGLHALGKSRDAKEMNQQALDLHIEVLGGEHPSTLEVMETSMLIAASENQLAEAEQAGKRLLELRIKVLGTEHPRTLWTMYRLSVNFNKRENFEKAAQMSRQALDLQRKVLGAEHCGTIPTMCTLSVALNGQGYSEEAEQISRQALELLIRKYGFGHSDTLKCMDILSSALYSQGRYKEAEQITRQTLELRVEIFGAEHPDTLNNMSHLSFVLLEQNQFKESEQMSRRLLDPVIQVLGAKHRNTLTTMYRLSTALYYQGHYREAERIIRQTFELRAEVLGAEHPDTLRSIYCLCLILYRQGRYKEAEQINLQALHVHIRVLGAEHPGTHAFKNCLPKIIRARLAQGGG